MLREVEQLGVFLVANNAFDNFGGIGVYARQGDIGVLGHLDLGDLAKRLLRFEFCRFRLEEVSAAADAGNEKCARSAPEYDIP